MNFEFIDEQIAQLAKASKDVTNGLKSIGDSLRAIGENITIEIGYTLHKKRGKGFTKSAKSKRKKK